MTKKRVKKECSIKNKRGGYPLNGASSSAVFHVSCNTICLFLHRNYVAPTDVITMKGIT